MAAGKAMVFAPHPDDDVLACGGTIAHKVRAGWQVFIVYMTDGRHSHSHTFDMAENPAPEQLRALRRQEAASAAITLGVPQQNLVFLDYEDRALALAEAEATARVKELVLDIGPEEVYYPSKMDRHPDHKATAAIVASALKGASSQPARFEYLIWGQEESGATEGRRVVTQRIADVLGLKKQALAQHKSQVALLYPGQPRPVLQPDFIQRFLSGYEEFVEAG